MDSISEKLSLDLFYTAEALIIVVGSILLSYVVNRFFNQLFKTSIRKKKDVTNYRFVQHLITAVIYMTGFALIIFNIPNLRHLASTLLAGAGIVAAIVGFASQQALSNVVSGVFIIIFKPYRLNDRITTKDGLSGRIEDIGLRHTTIRDYQNKRIVIPNSIIGGEYIINSDHTNSKICQFIDFDIAYTASIDKAREIIQSEAGNHPMAIDGRTKEEKDQGQEIFIVKVTELGDYSIKMRAWVWAEDPGKAFMMKCDLLESVKKRFDKEGVEIPYPYMNIISQTKNT